MSEEELNKVKQWLDSKKLIHPLSSLNLVDLSKALVRAANSKDTRVLFILLDGLGADLLQRSLPSDCFLRKHWKRNLLSVYPATTTAALTSIFTAQHPGEHGILGWQQRLFHRESSEYTDGFLLPWVRAKDHASLDRVPGMASPASVFDFESAFERELEVPFAGFSEYADSHFTRATYGKKAKIFRTSSDDLIESFEHVKTWWSQHSASFTYVYCKNPDSLEHSHGIKSAEVLTKLKKLNAQIETFIHETTNFDNRMIVVCADHGQIDGDFIDLTDKLNDVCDLSCEQRTPVFFPKPGVSDEALFERLRGALDPALWAILTPDQAEELRLFGTKTLSAKARAQLGSFVGVTISKQALHDQAFKLVGVHAGGLPEEMQVPLIVFGDKRQELVLTEYCS